MIPVRIGLAQTEERPGLVQPFLVEIADGGLGQNPSFETLGVSPNQLGLPFGSGAGHPLTLAQVPGWYAGQGIGTPAQDPDILTPDLSGTDYVAGVDPNGSAPYVPVNFMGTEPALGGNNYAGISAGVFTVSGVPTYLSEELIGTLTPTVATVYTVAAWMSQGETRNNPVDMEILLWLSTNPIGVGEVSAVLEEVNTTNGWTRIAGSAFVPAGYDRVIIRGDALSGDSGGYVYIDCVSVDSTARVGGTVEFRADGADPSALAASGSGSREVPYAALSGGIAAGALAVAAGGWYARRRWLG